MCHAVQVHNKTPPTQTGFMFMGYYMSKVVSVRLYVSTSFQAEQSKLRKYMEVSSLGCGSYYQSLNP